jgi:hypothetical protein
MVYNSFLVAPLLGLAMNVILALDNEFGSVLSFSISWKSLRSRALVL